ncbi:metallophosphoesterase [Bacillus luteolus]|uniref:Phosphoesterase n=1 Tax=Litchfieldia luteola TaxID=682179 RepID=A0ABR9QI66_9BACI|nr:metallophosphoesterase [Cytobacillus luteolus]MBE4908186.1 metallophosphoesterase [Cytobacillus luteolus]MBP1942972.1 putative phosphoesterase [Cytobacillus luteolus]
MRALIVSDSHGLTNELVVLKDRHMTDVDLLIHCGDSELIHNADEMLQFISVRGNCDHDQELPTEQVVKVGDKEVLITHGHLYNVKMTLMNLNYRAKELGASIVCFGHSHVAGAEMIDETLFINPGSIRLPRLRRERTYAILDLKDKNASVSFYDINGTKVDSLTTEVQFT